MYLSLDRTNISLAKSCVNKNDTNISLAKVDKEWTASPASFLTGYAAYGIGAAFSVCVRKMQDAGLSSKPNKQP